MTKQEAYDKLTELHKILGNGFHPENLAETYINMKTNERTFTDAEATKINNQLDEIFLVLTEEELYKHLYILFGDE